jgi:PAS domain S-box-containing protein
MAAGALVLVAWFAGSSAFMGLIKPDWPVTSPASAVLITLGGLCLVTEALALPRRDEPLLASRISGAGGSVLAIAGLYRFGATFAGRSSGMDTLWIHFALETSHHARMAPMTSLSCILLGSALVLSNRPRCAAPQQVLAILTNIAGLLGLSRYVYGGDALPPLLSMAPTTAFCFTLLGTGALLVRRDGGLAALISHKGPGGRLTRRLLPVVVVAPPLVGWLLLKGELLGWFGADTSVALFSVTSASLVGLLVWQAAVKLDRDEGIALRLSAIVESSNDAIVGMTLDGVVTSWNAAATRMYGYTEQDALGRTMKALIPAERADEERSILARIGRGEIIAHYETERIRKDGSRVPVSLTISPVKGPDGTVVAASKIARDISQHREHERQIVRLTRLYYTLSQVNQAIVRSSDRDSMLKEICRTIVSCGAMKIAWFGQLEESGGVIVPVAVSGDSTNMLGRITVRASPDSPEGRGPTGTAFREDRTFVSNDFLADPASLAWRPEVERLGIHSVIALPIRMKGKTYAVLCIYAPERDYLHGQEVALFEEIGGDVAYALEKLDAEQRQKEALHALRESEARLKIVTDTARIGLVIVSPAHRYRYANRAYADILRLPSHEIVGLRVADVLEPIYEEQVRPRLDRAFAGERVAYELTLPDAGGTGGDRIYAVTYEPGREAAERFVVVVIVEITERKRAEELLRTSESRYRRLIEGAPMAVVLMRAGRLIFGNRAFAAMHQLGAADEFYGKPLGSLVAGAHREAFDALVEANESGTEGDRTAEVVGVRGDGTEFPEIVSLSRVHLTDGMASIAFMQEVTALKHAQAERESMQSQLFQAQKMEAIGQLAGGVAHDFNNLLAAMMLNLDLLLDDRQFGREAREALLELKECTGRAANLTRQLLLFSRQRAMQKQQLDLKVILSNILRMLRRLLGEQVTLDFIGAPGEHRLVGDSGMIEQLITNLALNARDAMPGGGRIVVATQVVELTAESPVRSPDARAGRFVVLTVSDTGCGMDAAVLARIFEPFFTTKDKNRGTGLGLATAYGIVREHGGWIEVESAVGKGATFRVFFPKGDDAGNSAAAGRDDHRPLKGNEVILLAEDDRSLRNIVATSLRSLGYTVVEAANGEEAVFHWSAQLSRFDLLLTDMVMTGSMSGADLAARLQSEDPDLAVTIMSGYVPDEAGGAAPGGRWLRYMRKPFDVHDLAAAVRRQLDGR